MLLRLRVISIAMWGALMIAPLSVSQTSTPANTAPGQQRTTSEPYTGDLSIFDSPGRDERLQINRVMDILGIASAKSVADIGAGSGWFTIRAAQRVGSDGFVYAVDINPEAVRYIGERAHKERLNNVKAILSEADNPRLPATSVDAVLLLKTYHEIAHPITLLRNIAIFTSSGRKAGHHRSQWEWGESWRRKRCCRSRGERSRLHHAA